MITEDITLYTNRNMLQSILHFLLPMNFQGLAHKKLSINNRMHTLAMCCGASSAHFTALAAGYIQVHHATNDPIPTLVKV